MFGIRLQLACAGYRCNSGGTGGVCAAGGNERLTWSETEPQDWDDRRTHSQRLMMHEFT